MDYEIGTTHITAFNVGSANLILSKEFVEFVNFVEFVASGFLRRNSDQYGIFGERRSVGSAQRLLGMVGHHPGRNGS